MATYVQQQQFALQRTVFGDQLLHLTLQGWGALSLDSALII
jgi:hypothetical protein